MQISYDAEADAAYIRIVDAVAPGQAARQVGFIETPNGVTQVVLDFDEGGRLLGLEVLGARDGLAPEVLTRAVLPEAPRET